VANSYYIDSCIYLNLWRKENSDYFKKPFWLFAKRLFEKLEYQNSVIYYSGFILKELSFILTQEEFSQKRILFENSPNFKKVLLSEEELNEARDIEDKTRREISFYDIIHMILARKTNSILITRDKKLLKIAKRYNILAKLPEEL
jgi:predicted nucleic acid-binding protein